MPAAHPSIDPIDLAQSLFAARHDRRPERQGMEEMDHVMIGAWALREMGVDARPAMRTMGPGDGRTYLGYGVLIGTEVVSLNGDRGWGAIARSVLDLTPGRRCTLGRVFDDEARSLEDAGPEMVERIRRAAQEDAAWLRAGILDRSTWPVPLHAVRRSL